MAEEYRKVKSGRLKLKGNKKIALPKAARPRPRLSQEKFKEYQPSQDEIAHGGWWCLNEQSIMSGNVAIETLPNCYVMALDNGKFTLGASHNEGEGPASEEVLTVFRPPDANWFSLKSGYGKYLGINKDNYIQGVSETIGAHERWELVFENGKMALLAANGRFLSYKGDDEGYLMADATAAKDEEMIKVRTDAQRNVPKENEGDLDKLKSSECELAYVKMYQHSKVKLNPEDKKFIREAKTEGSLHETLLDRRVKMKADRFCK